MENKFYNKVDVTKLLNERGAKVSYMTVFYWAKKGYLKPAGCYKDGNRNIFVYSEESITNLLDELKTLKYEKKVRKAFNNQKVD